MAKDSENLIYDYLSAFPGGMNSGQLPRALPPSQAAFSLNTTFRGGFATDRPKWRRIELTFGSAAIQSAFESGLHQGSGFYRSQAGTGSILSSFSGRILQLIPDSFGGGSIVERTIPGNPNLSTQPQAWIWQSELWAIVSDGNSLPIFIDDTTARRSIGASMNIGAVAGPGFSVPAIGGNVTVTLAANYTAPLNALVNIDSGTHSGNYIVIGVGAPGSGTGYEAQLTNVNDVAGTALPIGTQIIVPTISNTVGTVATAFVGPVNRNFFFVDVFTQQTSFLGALVRISGFSYAVSNVGTVNADGSRTLTLNVRSSDPIPYSKPAPTIPAGTSVTNPYIAPQPGYTVGTLVIAATVPAVNGTVSVFLDSLYAGASNLAVQINGKNYRISPVAQAPPVPSTTVVLQNLTDNPGTTVAAGKFLFTIGELGIGRMGAYGQGRNWMSLIDGISFTASDLVGESSGSSAYNFRDAVLKVSKNEALTNGKPFRVPTTGDTITGMSFTAQLDASLGQGPLSVFTNGSVFSCLAPTDSTTWATLKTPILPESLIGSGATSHWAISRSNSDLLFRAPDGIRSQLIARLDFHKWGNTPISHEMQRVIALDDVTLLNFTSSTVFDNRLLMACNPVQGPTGVFHRGLMVINFDEISQLQAKSPSIYDGLWTGLQILQLIASPLNGYEGATRQFALVYNSVDNRNELWELLPDGAAITDQLASEAVCTGPASHPASPSPDSLTCWLDGGSNWSQALWTDRVSGIAFVGNGLGATAFNPPNLVSITSATSGLHTYTGTVVGSRSIFLEYSFTSILNEGIVLTIGGAANFKLEFLTAGTTLKLTTSGGHSITVAGLSHQQSEYIVQVDTVVGATTMTVYHADSLTVFGTATMAFGVDLSGSKSIVFSNTGNALTFNMLTRGFLSYSAPLNDAELSQTLQYVSGLMFGRVNVPVVCTTTNVRTIWAFESCDLFRGRNGELIHDFKALEDGEMSVDNVRGDVGIQVFYKPDQYPGWTLWRQWAISSSTTQPDAAPGYFPRMGLGRPESTDCNQGTEQALRYGYTFQVRVVIQGHCRVLSMRFGASEQAQPKFARPVCDTKTEAISIPRLDDFAIFNLSAGIDSLSP